MLRDPRSNALVKNFFGQWLQTRNVWLLTPDANTKFPWFDDNLRSAMVRETEEVAARMAAGPDPGVGVGGGGVGLPACAGAG